MIALVSMEFRKLWYRSSFLVLMVVLCCCNLAFLYYTQDLTATIPHHAYQTLEHTLATLPNEQRYAYLMDYQEKIENFQALQSIDTMRMQDIDETIIAYTMAQHPTMESYRKDYQKMELLFCDNLEQELRFLQQVGKEMKQLHDYPTYLKEIASKAQALSSISIFQKQQGFSSINIQKTASDYQKIQQVPITYESEKGIKEALSSPITNVLLCLAMMAIVTYLIFEEKEKDLFSIIKTTPNGQSKTILAKIIVIILSMVCLTAIMMLSNLLLTHTLFGLGDLQRSLQSLASYATCTYSLTVLQFLFCFFLFKCFAMSLLASLLLWISLLCKNRMLCIGITLSLLCVSFLCYLFIDANSSLRVLHYLNIISILQTDTFFQNYLNFNVFQHPLSLQATALFFLITFCAFANICTVLSYHHMRNMQIQPFRHTLPHRKRTQGSLSLLGQEAYKILVLQKAGLFLVLFLILQIVQMQEKTIYVSQQERFYMQYMEVLEGPITAKKEAFLREEQSRIDRLHQQVLALDHQAELGEISQAQYAASSDAISDQLRNEPIFVEVMKQYTYLQKGHNRQFLAPFVYEQAFTKDDLQLLPALLFILFITFACSHCFTFEYHHEMHHLLASSVKGRSVLAKKKLLIVFLLSCIFFLIAYLPSLLALYQTYGYPALSASITSLPFYEHVPLDLSIGVFFLITMIARILAFGCYLMILFAISVKLRNQLAAVFFSFLLFLLPIFLTMSGIDVWNSISLYPLLASSTLIATTQGILLVGVTLLGYGLAAVYSYRYVMKYSVV